MKKITQTQAEIFIIDKLRSRRYFGAHQILLENIPKGKPKEDKKVILKAIHSLAKMDFLLMKKKYYGIHVSLNPRKVKEIRGYLVELERR